MNNSLAFLNILFVVSISLVGCDKDDEVIPEPPAPDPPGDFVATINGNIWKPDDFSAYYFPKWKELYIMASNKSYKLETAIMLDSSSFLKNYLLESNGENAAVIIKDSIEYHSDLNQPDAGGNFLLTKFDTVNKTVSGQLKFNAAALGRNDKINFISSSIENITLKFEGADYPGNLSKSTVIGVKTVEWLSKDIRAVIRCRSGSLTMLKIEIYTPIFTNARNLMLTVPLSNPGIYPVVPDNPSNNSTCSNEHVRAVYNVHYPGFEFYPISGTFTIIDVDPGSKKMNAKFDITFKDQVTQQTIQIKNETLKLETWDPN